MLATIIDRPHFDETHDLTSSIPKPWYSPIIHVILDAHGFVMESKPSRNANIFVMWVEVRSTWCFRSLGFGPTPDSIAAVDSRAPGKRQAVEGIFLGEESRTSGVLVETRCSSVMPESRRSSKSNDSRVTQIFMKNRVDPDISTNKTFPVNLAKLWRKYFSWPSNSSNCNEIAHPISF